MVISDFFNNLNPLISPAYKNEVFVPIIHSLSEFVRPLQIMLLYTKDKYPPSCRS